jgi:hypothetical protein
MPLRTRGREDTGTSLVSSVFSVITVKCKGK